MTIVFKPKFKNCYHDVEYHGKLSTTTTQVMLSTYQCGIQCDTNIIFALTTRTWRWVTVQPIAAYWQTQTSSLQLGLRVGGQRALTDFCSKDPK